MVLPADDADPPDLRKTKAAWGLPQSPRTMRKSFQEILCGTHSRSMPPDREIETFKGAPAISFFSDELDSMAEKLKFALVGKLNRSVKLARVREAFQELKITGPYNILPLDPRHFLIELSLDSDYKRLWARAVWYFGDITVRIFKWTPDFSPEKESPMVPVWISLPLLPAHLYKDQVGLLNVARMLGRPLAMDEDTARGVRPSYARVCIEYDCTKKPPDFVSLHIRDRHTGEIIQTLYQKVNFESMPLYCDHCFHVGHDRELCYFNGRNPDRNTKNRGREITRREQWKAKGKEAMQENSLENKNEDSNRQVTTKLMKGWSVQTRRNRHHSPNQDFVKDNRSSDIGVSGIKISENKGDKLSNAFQILGSIREEDDGQDRSTIQSQNRDNLLNDENKRIEINEDEAPKEKTPFEPSPKNKSEGIMASKGQEGEQLPAIMEIDHQEEEENIFRKIHDCIAEATQEQTAEVEGCKAGSVKEVDNNEAGDIHHTRLGEEHEANVEERSVEQGRECFTDFERGRSEDEEMGVHPRSERRNGSCERKKPKYKNKWAPNPGEKRETRSMAKGQTQLECNIPPSYQ